MTLEVTTYAHGNLLGEIGAGVVTIDMTIPGPNKLHPFDSPVHTVLYRVGISFGALTMATYL